MELAKAYHKYRVPLKVGDIIKLRGHYDIKRSCSDGSAPYKTIDLISCRVTHIADCAKPCVVYGYCTTNGKKITVEADENGLKSNGTLCTIVFLDSNGRRHDIKEQLKWKCAKNTKRK